MRREQQRLADYLGHLFDAMTCLHREPPTALHACVRLEQLRQDVRAGLASGPAVVWDGEQVKRDGRKRNRSRAAALTRAEGDLDVVMNSDAPAT
jgi:hypothetical protein